MPSEAQRIDAFDTLAETLRGAVPDDVTDAQLDRLCHRLAFDASPAQLRSVIRALNSYLDTSK